tara:strand:- start:100 stop:354 length:255 start_codon:yes stop_codon:yes gene_type:complete
MNVPENIFDLLNFNHKMVRVHTELLDLFLEREYKENYAKVLVELVINVKFTKWKKEMEDRVKFELEMDEEMEKLNEFFKGFWDE